MKKLLFFLLSFAFFINAQEQVFSYNIIVDIPDFIKEDIQQLQNTIEKSLTVKQGYIFFPPDSIHMTLHQLEGLMTMVRGPHKLLDTLENVVKQNHSFLLTDEIKKGHLEIWSSKDPQKKGNYLVFVFPSNEALDTLAQTTKKQLQIAGFRVKEFEEFKPHITLGLIQRDQVKNELEIKMKEKNWQLIPKDKVAIETIALSEGQFKKGQKPSFLIVHHFYLASEQKSDLSLLSKTLKDLQEALNILQLRLNGLSE